MLYTIARESNPAKDWQDERLDKYIISLSLKERRAARIHGFGICPKDPPGSRTNHFLISLKEECYG